jgi:hypothetical protein
MAGHSRSKNVVTSLAYVLAIHVFLLQMKKTRMPATSAGMTATIMFMATNNHQIQAWRLP